MQLRSPHVLVGEKTESHQILTFTDVFYVSLFSDDVQEPLH